MLKVTFSEKEGFTVAKLEGALDDACDLTKLLGHIPTPLRVVCSGVSRINSIGVKRWINYFQGRNRSLPLEFVEFPPIFVQQLNALRNFVPANTIKSVQLPYSCQECAHSFTLLSPCEDIKKTGMVPLDVSCPKCSKPADFDDFPDEYLHFIMNG